MTRKINNNLSQMIIIFGKVGTFSGLKKEISCQNFKNHASETPNISSRIVVDPKNHLKGIHLKLSQSGKNLRGTILSRLDFSCKVVMCPASVAQIRDFYSHIFIYSCSAAIPATKLKEFNIVV